MPLLLATRSSGKLRELSALFTEAGIVVETLHDAGLAEVPEEDTLEAHATFAENALAKARFFAQRTGRVVVADDSGLCVDALDGRPGVHSKRWSGRTELEGAALDAANNALLLHELAAAAQRGRPERSASYVCAAAAAWPVGWTSGIESALTSADVAGALRVEVCTGSSAGVILEEPRGSQGFGYDPLFASVPLGGRTMAEVSQGEKSAVSHRGAAMRNLLALLDTRGALDQVARCG